MQYFHHNADSTLSEPPHPIVFYFHKCNYHYALVHSVYTEFHFYVYTFKTVYLGVTSKFVNSELANAVD